MKGKQFECKIFQNEAATCSYLRVSIGKRCECQHRTDIGGRTSMRGSAVNEGISCGTTRNEDLHVEEEFPSSRTMRVWRSLELRFHAM